MKKISLLLMAVMASFSIGYSQSLPNGSFEEWENAQKPEHWSTSLNATIMQYIPISANFAVRSLDAQDGNYALEVTSQMINLPTLGEFNVPALVQLGVTTPIDIDLDLIGELSSGNFENLSLEDLEALKGLIATGDACTGTPTGLKGWYKFLPDIDSGDEVIVSAYTSKWNETLQYKEIISVGNITISESTNTWQEFVVPFDEVLIEGESCDSISCVIVMPASSVATKLYLDNVSLTNEPISSINENHIMKVKIVPNPTSSQITVTPALQDVNYNVEVFSLLGKSVIKEDGLNNSATFNIEQLAKGLYVVRVVQEGKKYHSKFIIQ